MKYVLAVGLLWASLANAADTAAPAAESKPDPAVEAVPSPAPDPAPAGTPPDIQKAGNPPSHEEILNGSLPYARTCAAELTRGSSLATLASILERSGIADGHRLILDLARGLPTVRERVSTGSALASAIELERLTSEYVRDPLPMLRLQPISSGDIAFDFVLQTRRSTMVNRASLGRTDAYLSEQAYARYSHALADAVAQGDVSEFLADGYPIVQLALRVPLPDEAVAFIARENRKTNFLQFSPATRVDIYEKLGVFEAVADLQRHFGRTDIGVREFTTSEHYFPRTMTYNLFPELKLPFDVNPVTANILFYKFLYRQIVRYYPEALGYDGKYRQVPAATDEGPRATPSKGRLRRLTDALARVRGRGRAVPVYDKTKIEQDFARRLEAPRGSFVEFHVETKLGPLKLRGYRYVAP